MQSPHRNLDLGSRLREVGMRRWVWLQLALRILPGVLLAVVDGVVLLRDPEYWHWALLGTVVVGPILGWSWQGFGRRVLWMEVHERGFVLGSLFRRRIARRSTLSTVIWAEDARGGFRCELHFKNGAIQVIDATLHTGRTLGWVLYCWWRDGEEIPRLLYAVREWEG